MRYIVDHDIHIHSRLSSCSHDPEQSPEVILNYATECGYKYVCLTDHFWDETIPGASNWYKPQNFAHICESLPLPQNDKVKFFFGCEAEMDQYLTVGVSKEVMEKLDFFIVPITHLHMAGFTRPAEDNTNELRVQHFIKRFNALLDYDLPAHKVGIAHLTCHLMTPEKTVANLVECLALISDDTFRDLFTRIRSDESYAALRYVFRWSTHRRNLRSAVPYSSLGERMKKYVLTGGVLHETLGAIRI